MLCCLSVIIALSLTMAVSLGIASYWKAGEAALDLFVDALDDREGSLPPPVRLEIDHEPEEV